MAIIGSCAEIRTTAWYTWLSKSRTELPVLPLRHNMYMRHDEPTPPRRLKRRRTAGLQVTEPPSLGKEIL